jgi:hypothetical protein
MEEYKGNLQELLPSKNIIYNPIIWLHADRVLSSTVSRSGAVTQT